MAAFLTLHSYSQMWLVPWGYTRARVKDYDDLVYMGRKAIEALNKVHGTEYEIGTSTSMLYPTSGKPQHALSCYSVWKITVYTFEKNCYVLPHHTQSVKLLYLTLLSEELNMYFCNLLKPILLSD